MNQEKKYYQKPWSLEDLYSGTNSEEYQTAMNELGHLTDEIQNYREMLSPEMAVSDFGTILQKLEKFHEIASRLLSYAELLFSADTQNSEAMSLVGQTEAIITEAHNKIIFFSLWWKSISDDEAQRLIKEFPDYQYYLKQLRNTKQFTLPEFAEQIINIKDISGKNALNTIYESLTNRYQFTLKIDGKSKKVSRSGLMQYVRNESPEIRKQAYRELYRVFGEDGKILGQIYQSIARDWYFENVKIRKYPSPISVRNIENDIPDRVVDLLLDTCIKNKSVFQRYFALKKEMLALETFTRYDIYAPLQKEERLIPFEEGLSIVQSAFTDFDPEFAAMAMRVLDEDHMDSADRRGKRDGAFCLTTSPKLTPWVLVNYQGRISDVSTLAHELGHAVHSLFANRQNIFEHQACLPLAETASTFAEMLLVDALLKEEKNPDIRKELIMQQMDDFYATIQRQAYFALFEKKAHEMIASGTTVEQLNAIYLDNLHDQFGEVVNVSDEFKWEWVSIPHIFATPFYVYAYTFGQLLVLSLYKKYKEEGKKFIPQYKQILSAGGSKSPEDILTDAGFNFYDPTFWQGGFDFLTEKMTEIEKN